MIRNLFNSWTAIKLVIYRF